MTTADPQMRVRTGIITREPRKDAPAEIFNLTKHRSTWREQKMGVIEPTWRVKKEIIGLQSFPEIPDQENLDKRAHRLAGIAKLSGCKRALIGGASFFMSTLEMALCYHGIFPVFSWNLKNDSNEWQFGGFVESALVMKGWLKEDAEPF
jgi:hypothetical protein